jgi:uncharacterized protein (DUF58 family)
LSFAFLPVVGKSNSCEKKDGGSKVTCRVEARFFIMLSLSCVFYFIAGNISSGWLYLMAAAGISTLMVALILPFMQVALLDVEQTLPSQATAGETITASVSIKRRRSNQLYSWLRLFNNLPTRWLRVSYVFTGDNRIKSKLAVDGSRKKNIEKREIVLDDVIGQVQLNLPLKGLKRGIYSGGVVLVETCFPLGLIWVRRSFFPQESKTLTVYPKALAIEGFFLYRLPANTMGVASGMIRSNNSARQSLQTRGVREYVRGDNPRIIHWASTAKVGKLMVREFEAEGLPKFDVLLDLDAPYESQKQFELAVCAAASLLSLGYRLGTGPSLRLNPDVVSKLNMPLALPGIQEQMEVLARVQPVASKGVDDSLPLRSFARAGRSLVAIGPINHLPRLTAASYAVEIGDPAACMPAGSSTTKMKIARRSIVNSEEDICEL